MKQNIANLVLVVALSLTSNVTAKPGDGQHPVLLLESGSYKELEALEKSLVASREFDDFGTPLLSTFYKVVSGKGLTDDNGWVARKVILDRWHERETSVASKLALANHHYNYAWFLRGGNYASKTLPERLELYREHLKKTDEILTWLATNAYNHPAYWELWLNFGVSSSWTQVRFEGFYKIATNARPDYFEYHAAKARYYLPRWHGTEKKFQETMSNLEVELEKFYGEKTYGWLQARMRYSEMFTDGQADWTRVNDSFRAIINDHGTRKNAILYAKLACMAEAWGELAKQLPIDPKPSDEEWYERGYDSCVRLAKRYDSGKTLAELKQQENGKSFSAFNKLPEAVEHSVEASSQMELGDEAISDRSRLASLSGDQTLYEELKVAVFDIAAHNPQVLAYMDEYRIQLLQHDYQEVIVMAAKQNTEVASKYIQRVIVKRNFIARDVKDYYRAQLNDGYVDWLIQHPQFWEKEDIQYIPLQPAALMEKIESIAALGLDTLTLQREAVNRFAQSDSEFVAGYIARQDGRTQHQLWGFLQQYLIKQEGEASALSFIFKYDNSKYDRTRSVIITLAHNGVDPIELFDRLGLDVPESLLAYAVTSLAYNEPKLAANYLPRLTSSKKKTVDRVGKYFQKKFEDEFYVWLGLNPAWVRKEDIQYLAKHDSRLAKKLVRLQRDRKFKIELQKIIESSVMTGSPAEVLPTMVLPDSKLKLDDIEKLKKVAGRDAEEAMLWIQDNRDTVPLVTVAVVANVASGKGLVHVFEWLEQFPDHSSLDSARYRAFQTIEMKRPDIAAQMILDRRVHNPEVVIHELTRNWVFIAPEEAMAFVLQLTEHQDIGWRGLGDGKIEQGNPDEAIQFYLKVDDPRERKTLVRELLPKVSPSEFDALADKVGMGELERESYRPRSR